MSAIHTCSDARQLARRRLPWMVFDYIDGAAAEGYGEQLNKDRIRAIRLQPRVLNNVEKRSLAVEVFGQTSEHNCRQNISFRWEYRLRPPPLLKRCFNTLTVKRGFSCISVEMKARLTLLSIELATQDTKRLS